VAVLAGALSGGLLAHHLGLQRTALVIGAVFAAAGLLALTIPRSDASEQTGTGAKGKRRDLAAPGVYRRIRLRLGLLAAIQLVLAPIVAVIPVLAIEGVDGDARHVGMLTALYGLGSMFQILATKAVLHGVAPRIVVSTCLALLVACAVWALIRDSLVSAAGLMVSFGFGVASIGTLVNTAIQTSVPEEGRDHYVARFALVYTVPLAVGSGLWGLLADFVPVPTIAVISTVLVVTLLPAAWSVARRRGESEVGSEASRSNQDSP
jgi:predicted MFS family arabinose efflux permease